MNVLVETKAEYTSHLTKIIAPYIHEIIQSIYNDESK